MLDGVLIDDAKVFNDRLRESASGKTSATTTDSR
jgi:hypothetical protein